MKCYYHVEKSAVAQCVKCGKFLCKDCVIDANVVYCKNCADISFGEFQFEKQEQLNEQKRNLNISGIVFIICFFSILVLSLSSNGTSVDIFTILLAGISSAVSSLFFAGIPYGWRKLSGTKLRVILILPLLGWIIYFAIKFQVSYWIGWFYLIRDIISYYKKSK